MAERNDQQETHAPMRIVFICGAGIVSGREIATLNLMQGLRGRGHDVRCIASTWGDGKLAERLEAAGVPFISLPLGFISKTLTASAAWMTLDQLRRVPRLWLGFRRYLREFKPDVVVQTNFHHIFMLWPLLNPRKTFFHVHDGFPASDFYRRLARFLDRRLRAFIGVSRYIARNLVELGISAEKVCYVHNGVAIEDAADGQSEASGVQTETHGEASSAVVIGIIGQVGDWKGHDDLVEALRELKAAGLSFSCVIYGEGKAEYVGALKERIERYGLAQHVRHAGFVKSPRAIYAGLDICVVPSRFQEPFGMVAAEAAHFGVPVVATRRGGLPEIVEDRMTGFLVEAEAPQQLAEKLRALIEDEALRAEMGRAARAHARQQFTQARMAAQIEAVFARALETGDVEKRSLDALPDRPHAQRLSVEKISGDPAGEKANGTL
jgi:glycosyltransferase involved in cell wall biosynthesis